jgi:hypothetical protein
LKEEEKKNEKKRKKERKGETAWGFFSKADMSSGLYCSRNFQAVGAIKGCFKDQTLTFICT